MSILSVDDANADVFSKLLRADMNKQIAEPQSYETVILSSQVYSRATVTALRSIAPDNDTATYTGGYPPKAVAGTRSKPKPASTQDPVAVSVRNLGVKNFYAISRGGYTASIEGELSLEHNTFIHNVRILDKDWCTGQIRERPYPAYSDDELGPIGRFLHQRVLVLLELSKPATVRTKRVTIANIEVIPPPITIQKGQELHVQVSPVINIASWLSN